MSLLDDFEVLDNSVDKECKEGTMNRFLYEFISSHTVLTNPKNQIRIHEFDVYLPDVKKCLYGIYEPERSELDKLTAEISWDMSDWIENGHDKVFIGFNFLRTNDFIKLKFKLFDSSSITPDRGIRMNIDKWGLHEIDCYKNTYKGYKILSVADSHNAENGMGWIEFDMNKIIKLSGTHYQYPECDNVGPVYKVIPFKFSNSLGETLLRKYLNKTFEKRDIIYEHVV